MVGDELGLVLLVDDLIGLALGESMIDILDGLVAYGFGLLGEIKKQLQGFDIHTLDGNILTKVLFICNSNLS